MAKQDRTRREACGAIIHDEYVPDGAVTIDFVGVWDTVGAVGMPFEELRALFNWIYPMRFSELTPSSRIKRACHALSIDDDRRTFYPELWNEKGIPAAQVDQVWFAGVHSNVGGGYVKHGMSLVALDWMMAEAEQCGLRFIQADREYVHTHQDVHDELYDARAGLGVYYRWEPRDLVKLCHAHKSLAQRSTSAYSSVSPTEPEGMRRSIFRITMRWSGRTMSGHGRRIRLCGQLKDRCRTVRIQSMVRRKTNRY